MSDDETPRFPIAETFYTLQGEGSSVGTPAVFLRFGGCNLLCGNPTDPDAAQADLEASDDATWVCDTIEVWRNATTYTIADLLAHWRDNDWLGRLRRDDAVLVLTGGEPLLQQRGDDGTALAALLDAIDATRVEVETNGTIVPLGVVDDAIDQYNVSVKLANSGMPGDKRLNETAIKWFRDHPDAMFKFVVSRDRDREEIHDLATQYDIPTRDIMLMPAGASIDALHGEAGTAQRVAEFCKTHGYRYSPRLHIDLWNQQTGV